MKINKELANQLLKESEIFRQHTLSILFKGDNIKDKMISYALEACKNSQKTSSNSGFIAAIKAVRQFSMDNRQEILDNMPEVQFIGEVAGLAWSKKFVEDNMQF